MAMKTRLKMKNRSHRYGIHRPRPRHKDAYTKYKTYLNIIITTCIKEYLSKI